MKSEFFDAVRRGDAVAVAALLEADAQRVRSVDGDGKTALHWAAETDQVEVARLLIGADAEIEAKTAWGASPLDWAATLGSRRVAELLLAHGAEGLNFIAAAALGLMDRVRRTVESGEDLAGHRRRGAPDVPNEHWPADSAGSVPKVVEIENGVTSR